MALMVLGGIYTGLFTPTEAGAVGCFTAFVICLLNKEFLKDFRKNLGEALLDTGKTTCMIFAIIVGVIVFTNFLVLTGVTNKLTSLIMQLPLPPKGIMFCILVMYIILGCFLESIGMILLTVPILLPAIKQLGFDPIWFGVFVVLVCETGLITPPVGIGVYIVKGVAGKDITLGEIFSYIGPFVIAGVALAIVLIYFQQVALFLPSLMN